jgi:hypothetical protein
MIEVFKTNISDRDHADAVVERIHELFPEYHANFDLEDCDRILRVSSIHAVVHASALQDLLLRFGYTCEVLADASPVSELADLQQTLGLPVHSAAEVALVYHGLPGLFYTSLK